MLREKLSQVYDEASSLNNENKVWLEEPVDFKTFNESIDYLNAFPLSDRQYRDIYNVIGKDPKKIFNQERQNDLGVLLWGKGSGKDLSVARVFNYLFYILLCMRNAQAYLWLTDRTTHMDIINVAKKGEQARKIFFSYFIHILKTAPWFRSHFIIRESNKIISKPVSFKPRDTIEIGGSSVIATDANIRAFAETSANESYEGYNIAAWCMDEACLAAENIFVCAKTGVSKTIKEWYDSQEVFWVRAYDFIKKETVLVEAHKVFRKTKTKLLKVTLQSKRSFIVGENHLLYQDTENWTKTSTLSPGDKILIRDTVVCYECGKEVKRLTSQHFRKHDLTKEAYFEKYPERCICNLRKRFSVSEFNKNRDFCIGSVARIGSIAAKKALQDPIKYQRLCEKRRQNRLGKVHSVVTKRKMGKGIRRFWENNPEKLALRNANICTSKKNFWNTFSVEREITRKLMSNAVKQWWKLHPEKREAVGQRAKDFWKSDDPRAAALREKFRHLGKQRFKDNPEFFKEFARKGNSLEHYGQERRARVSQSNRERTFCISDVLPLAIKGFRNKILNVPERKREWSEKKKATFNRRIRSCPVTHALYRQQISNTHKERIRKDPRRIDKAYYFKHKIQTSLEIQLEELLSTWFPGEWVFTGNNSFHMLNGKVPDFKHLWKNKIIEAVGSYWHGEEYETERNAIFNSAGHEVLFIWDYELTEDNLQNVKQKVLDFSRNSDIMWESITSIEDAGYDHVYDFEVPEYHNYFYEGALHHNSAFKSKAEIENAYDIYKTLKTSGSSRANKNFKPIGFVISYPRQAEGDITVDMYNASLRSNNIYGSFGWSWQIKPAHLYSGKTFPFTHKRIGKFLLGENISATIQVPIELKKDFYDDFLKDASDALCKHFCIPPSTIDQWAVYPELFYSCVTQGNSIIEFSQDVIREWNEEEKKEERRIVLRFHKLNITFTEAKHKQYVLWFDNAEVNCDACVAIGHIEHYNGLDILIQDANLVWAPDPEKDLKVSLLNVEQWITDILPKQLNLVSIGFDAWNTLALREKLRTTFPNIRVIQHSLNNQDYGFFEGLVYKNQVRTPFQAPIGQLVNLQKGNTVPRPKRGFFKDQADGLVGIAKLLLSDEAQKTSNLSTAPASVRTESLAAAPNLFQEVNNPFAPQAMNSQQPVFEHRLVDIDSIRQMMGVNKNTSRTFSSGSGDKSNVRRLPLSTKV